MTHGRFYQRECELGQQHAGKKNFALRFAVLCAVGFGLYCFPYAELGIGERGFDEYLKLYTALAGGVLGLFEPALQVHGTHLVGRTALQIVKNCDASEVNLLFAAAVLALPGSRLRRAAAALGGVLVLIAINVLRICSLYFMKLDFPAQFEFFHLELWPLLLIALAAGEFALCARWIQQAAQSRAERAACSTLPTGGASVVQRG